jgi:hypothetical protein
MREKSARSALNKAIDSEASYTSLLERAELFFFHYVKVKNGEITCVKSRLPQGLIITTFKEPTGVSFQSSVYHPIQGEVLNRGLDCFFFQCRDLHLLLKPIFIPRKYWCTLHLLKIT